MHWMLRMRRAKSIILARVAAWPAFVVLQPRTAKPVEMRAPVMPTACEATAAARPTSTTWVTTCFAVAAAPSTTAPAVSPPSTAFETVSAAAASFWSGQSKPLLLQGSSNPPPRRASAFGGIPAPRASRARTHSSISSATARAFQSSKANCCRRSAWLARSASESPAKVSPLVTAEPMPSPTPMGGAVKSSTAEAMPSPALAVLPTFTPSHWPVKRSSSSRSLCNVRLCTSRSFREAAQRRLVAEA
mmetsp:Transcript_109587/g.338273  ORF Transcript_109587/g.338273 Transcript_109587/m.338273 type:complete len:246 (+) Transcript_109587:274-1011(+)